VSLSRRPSAAPTLQFTDPPWDAPLDAAREIESIPSAALIRGMFIIPVIEEAKRAGASLAKRERYVPFQFYPLREHAQLMVEASSVVFPQLPLRQALRRLGRGAPRAFVASTLGRVVLQSAQGVIDVVTALAKGYELNMKPGRAYVDQPRPRVLDVTMEQIYFFVDSHHVGAFEGALHFAGTPGKVRVHRIDASTTVLRIEW
jgi:uncharacterized protein (TIGR02265 family)